MQVGYQEMYEKAKVELAAMHERAMMTEVALEAVTGELEELKKRLPEAPEQSSDAAVVEEEAVLEKLRTEVKG